MRKKPQITTFSAQDLKYLELERARKRLPWFNDYVLRDEAGRKITSAPHHYSWDEHIEYAIEIGKGAAILAPMASAKTNQIVIGETLKYLGWNPNLRIMIVSSAETIAAERLTTIGNYIENSPQYHEVFPWVQRDRSAPWNNTRINVKRTAALDADGMVGSINSSVSAFGYTSRAGIGARCDILICDDVVDESNSVIGESSREHLKSMIQTQWISRMDSAPLFDRDGRQISNGPILIFIGTRYHEEDLYADLIANTDGFCTMVQGVSKDFHYYDATIYGAVANPPHPVFAEYQHWAPDYSATA